ncbi:MAG: tetratricopeptide repeat protein [Ekhidna sp.]
MRSKSLLITLIFSTAIALGQDMNKGFSMLEKGEFKQAENFFQGILSNHPNNKTGLICYGRAVGLSGNPEKSITIFNDLLNTYPNDKEVLLNKAEAFLWLKDSKSAIVEYESILQNEENLFSALLGAANSYSMEKEYKKSYQFILKALDNQPTNDQAKISAKYIRLGYANQLASEQQEYDAAIDLVNQNLSVNQNDQESLGLLANIHLIAGNYDEASSVYSTMDNPLNALLGQSVALHLLKDNAEALIQAKASFDLTLTSEKDETKRNTHWVSALLWNNKLKEARNYVDSLILEFPSNTELIATQAEVAMYEADFEQGIESYTTYLGSDSSSFKGNLGRADAFHALGLDQKAYDYALETLVYYPGQKDVVGFIGRLNQQHSPRISSSYTIGKASDGSSFKLWSNDISMSLSPTLKGSISYAHKDFQSASSQIMTLAASFQVNGRIKLNGSYGSMKINLTEQEETHRSDIDISAQYRVSKVQNVTIAYQNEIQDFNAQLLNQNLKTTHFVLKNAMYWKASGIGSYTELYKSFLSDGNSRNLMFTSLYKNFNTTPSLKAGINYLTMSFDEQLPTAYFSPNSYNQLEAFTSINYAGKKLPFKVNMDLAAGIQSLEGNGQTTWRTKVMIEKSAGRFDFSLSGSYSSISAAQTNGFSFSEITGKVIWRISEKPIFSKRFESN